MHSVLRLRTAFRGFSLVELMVALTVAALLLLTALPALSDYLANARLRAAGQALLAEAMLARSEALKRNASVTLSVDGSTVRLTDDATPSSLARQRELPQATRATPSRIVFSSTGRPAADASIEVFGDGITCSTALRCPGLRIDAGGGIRLCGDKTSCD